MSTSKRKKNWGFCSLVLTAILFACPAVYADRTSLIKQLFQRRATNVESMDLQDKHGPWLILAGTFSGETARTSAETYAKELSQRLKIPAFVMQKSDGTDSVFGAGVQVVNDEFGRQISKPIVARYANQTSQDTVAVLVGEFHSKDDPQIDLLRKKVRDFKPKAKIPGFDDRDKAVFLTRNPLLPEDFFQTPRVDDFVEQLNRQEWIKHSLLDCPGRFTVRVATFRGSDVLSVADRDSHDINNQANQATALDRAASKAHKMASSLRGRGVEAYEFHDRHGSYVMIGSFDALGSEVTTGQFQYDPRIVTIIQQYCGYREVVVKDPATGAVSKSLSLNSENRIPFDIEGKPIAVPRPSTSQLYGGSVFK